MATGNLATRTTDAQSIFAVPPRPAAIRAIAATGGFSGLDGIAATVLVQRGQTLFFEGDPARSCFRVVTGAVRSSRLLADGRRQVGDFFLPDDFFGFGHTGTYRSSAEAITDTALISYPRKLLDATVEEQPGLGRALFAMVSGRLADAHLQMLLLGRMNAEQRVATFLLALSERCRTGDVVRLPMTREDIADHLGLTIETVSRTISKLAASGLIVLRTSNNIRILDRDALEDLAEGT